MRTITAGASVRATDGAGDASTDGAWHAAATGAAVADALAVSTRVMTIQVVGSVGSTQDVARDLALAGAGPGTLVVAEHQRAGRGRSGRDWEDDVRPGASLAATLVLDPPRDAALVPHAVGLAVLDAIAAWPAVRAGLKWPNDVVVRVDARPRKLAGVLVERTGLAGRDLLLVGIGVNVDRRHLPDEADRTGLADRAGEDVRPDLLLAGLVRGLDAALRLLDAGPPPLLARYRAHSDTVGREVRVVLPDGSELRGRAGVDDGGRLTVDTPTGRRTVIAGTLRDASAPEA